MTRISLLYRVYKHGMFESVADTFLKLENRFLFFLCTSCLKCTIFNIQTNLNLQTITKSMYLKSKGFNLKKYCHVTIH